jgi:hypothetical protein
VIAILMALMLTAVLVAHLARWGLAAFGLFGWYAVTIVIAGVCGAGMVAMQVLLGRVVARGQVR